MSDDGNGFKTESAPPMYPVDSRRLGLVIDMLNVCSQLSIADTFSRLGSVPVYLPPESETGKAVGELHEGDSGLWKANVKNAARYIVQEFAPVLADKDDATAKGVQA